ncbi:MAG: MerR family DNA-binding protein [Microcystaceae cyanobacterium]
MLAVHDAGQLPCGIVKKLLLQKLESITEQIEALEILKSELQGILSGWQEMPSYERIPWTICPNIESPL